MFHRNKSPGHKHHKHPEVRRFIHVFWKLFFLSLVMIGILVTLILRPW